MPDLFLAFALLASVLMVTALASGLVERSPLSFPLIFLGFGLVLGAGLIIVLGAVPLALLVGFGWVVAFIGGAVLASTDPVVLREIVRDERIPRSVRQVLRIEAGMQIPGSIRVFPDQVTDWAAGQPTERPIVAYCT